MAARLKWLVRAGAVALAGAAVFVSSRAEGARDPRWPNGEVNVYAPTHGTTVSMLFAAKRWTGSGADVKVRVVLYERDADVVVRLDDRRLHALCGRRCFGYTPVIGRPPAGKSEILLRENLADPTPLAVWVAAHELGHVLGLSHRRGGEVCTIMSPGWFDTPCAPSMGADIPRYRELWCVPAPVDVDAAARIYGGGLRSRGSRCQ